MPSGSIIPAGAAQGRAGAGPAGAASLGAADAGAAAPGPPRPCAAGCGPIGSGAAGCGASGPGACWALARRKPDLVASTLPPRISANATAIAGVNRSPRIVTPRATATAGFAYVMTVALAGPTSAISAKKTRKATAVQTTARPTRALSTLAEGIASGQVSAAAGA